MINTIDKNDLTGIAMMVDCLRYTVQELQEDFFEKYDSKNKEGIAYIAWEFNRNRARAEIINHFLWDIEQELNKLGVKR